MSNVVYIVFSQHWRIKTDEYLIKHVEMRPSKIRKIFNSLDDAIDYINSVPGQNYPPDNPLNELSIEDDLAGFYLYQDSYEVA